MPRLQSQDVTIRRAIRESAQLSSDLWLIDSKEFAPISMQLGSLSERLKYIHASKYGSRETVEKMDMELLTKAICATPSPGELETKGEDIESEASEESYDQLPYGEPEPEVPAPPKRVSFLITDGQIRDVTVKPEPVKAVSPNEGEVDLHCYETHYRS